MIKPSTLSFQKVYFFKNWFFFLNIDKDWISGH